VTSSGQPRTSSRTTLGRPRRTWIGSSRNILDSIAGGSESRSLRAKLKEIERQQAEAANQLQRSTGLLGLQQQDLAHLEATTLLLS